jgi:hypothetical protein
LFSPSGFSKQGSTSSTAGAMANSTLVLNIDESKLQGAPSFEGNNWNELQQGQFDQRVYSYFGVNRTSGTGTPGSSISGQGASDYNGAKGGDLEQKSTTTPPPQR